MWILYFIFYPDAAFTASCNGILLWFYQILPALLPYAILSGLLVASGLFSGNSRNAEAFVILCGFLFGFPIGSKLTADFCERGLISPKKAQILCAFTNNMSPVFVSAFVLTAQLKAPRLLLPTYGILYGIPFIYGMAQLLRLHREPPAAKLHFHTAAISPGRSAGWKFPRNNDEPVREAPESKSSKKAASRFDLNMQIIDAGIISSFETLIRLCGYIVMFSVLADMLTLAPLPFAWMQILLTGIMEITNGIAAVAASSLPFSAKYLLSVAFLTFGGISGAAQTGSMIKNTGLSVAAYVRTKLILTALTTASACLFLWLCFSLS